MKTTLQASGEAGTGIFAQPQVVLERRADGTMLVGSAIPMRAPARSVGVWLDRWAKEAPERVLFAERTPQGDWRRVGYGEARRVVGALATWILRNGLSADRPLVILSDNSVDHALLSLAAMYVGVPVAGISSAYSLASQDHAKLKWIVELLDPGAIYVADGPTFAPALSSIAGLHRASLVASAGEGEIGGIAFDTLKAQNDDAAVRAAHEAVGPDTIARFLFTSGSTAMPKAVINTHRMLTCNQEARAACWPMLEAAPPVIVDWLPWSHTFGANHNFNMMLRNGGSLYIDDGKPVPHLLARTIANIKDVRPTILFNVPRGYGMLVEALRTDAQLREAFFSARAIFYAAAALPQNIWDALQAMSVETTGSVTPLIASWGATETAPLATDCHFQADRGGNIGVPVPGTELKLVPNAGKLEIRVKGPNVMPGYWRQDDLTRKAFDEEGYLITGDAVRFADPQRPEKGLFFDGRISEDFKLTTGTWVSVGDLRVRAIAALDPIAQDIVVTGHDRDEVGFLVFPNIEACRRLAGFGPDAQPADILAAEVVRAALAAGLRRLKAEGGGSSRYAGRARFLARPPMVDAGEITDKGYINQSAVLANRADEIALLEGEDDREFVAAG